MALIDGLGSAHLDASFASTDDEVGRVARNVVINTGIDATCLDRAKIVRTSAVVSHRLDQREATSQKKSRRCWLFSSFNLLRDTARERIGVKDFEFSQNYVLFFDKLERANHFLRDMVTCTSESVDSCLVQSLLSEVLDDGGRWDMVVSLYQKHGLVPKEAISKTQSSSNTSRMSTRLQVLLYRSALEVRELLASDASPEEAETLTSTVLDAVQRILMICLGESPRSSNWKWCDDAGRPHHDGTVTPKESFDRYVGVDLSEYVCLVDDPCRAHAKGQVLTVEHLGSVIEGWQIRYTNAEMTTVEETASWMIARGKPVWFGADVFQQSERDLGLLVRELHSHSGLFGVDLKTTKEQRALSGEPAMNRIMLFTGINIDEDGHPRRWRVGDSWGGGARGKEFLTMDDV